MRFRYFLASLLLALVFAGEASARGTLDSILPEIRAQHPGRLSDAEPWTDSDGRTHYRIKWLTPEGRILYFNADAESGRYSNGGDDRQTDGGGRWHGGRQGGEDEQSNGDDRGRRSHWNGDGGGGDGNGGGRWNGGGDWHDRHGGDNGDRGGHGDRGGWRGGHDGDNGGRHSHGNGY